MAQAESEALTVVERDDLCRIENISFGRLDYHAHSQNRENLYLGERWRAQPVGSNELWQADCEGSQKEGRALNSHLMRLRAGLANGWPRLLIAKK